MADLKKYLLAGAFVISSGVSENLEADDKSLENKSQVSLQVTDVKNRVETGLKAKGEISSLKQEVDLDSFFADEKNYNEYLNNLKKNDFKIPDFIVKRSWSNLAKSMKSGNVDGMPRDLSDRSPSLYNLILSGNLNVHPDILEYFQLVSDKQKLAQEEQKLAQEEQKLAQEEQKLAQEEQKLKFKQKLLDIDTKGNLENAELANSIASSIKID